MSIPLETGLLLLGPILAVVVLMIVSAMWRKNLANLRATETRLETLERRIAAVDRPQPTSARFPETDLGGPARRPNAGRRADPPAHSPSKESTPAVNLISVPNLARGGEGHAPPESDLNRRFAAVWDLAEAGASAETIARATGQSVGRIELILGLKRQTESTTLGLRLPGPSSR